VIELESEVSGVVRPPAAPEYGAKTAQAVLDIIRLYPEAHDQKVFEVLDVQFLDSQCGTMRCVAGWAQWLHDGIVDTSRCSLDNPRWVVEVRAAEVLGLNDDDASMLFFSTDEEQAIAALEYVARGEPIDWDAIGVD
jgi:hypothetical protein